MPLKEASTAVSARADVRPGPPANSGRSRIVQVTRQADAYPGDRILPQDPSPERLTHPTPYSAPRLRPSDTAMSIAARFGAGRTWSAPSFARTGSEVTGPQPRHPQPWQRWIRSCVTFLRARSQKPRVLDRWTRGEPHLGQLST